LKKIITIDPIVIYRGEIIGKEPHLFVIEGRELFFFRGCQLPSGQVPERSSSAEEASISTSKFQGKARFESATTSTQIIPHWSVNPKDYLKALSSSEAILLPFVINNLWKYPF
jgi:hypothetical protein